MSYMMISGLMIYSLFSPVQAAETNSVMEGTRITFCEDSDGFPPYIWAEQDNHSGLIQARGFNTEVITKILAKHKIQAVFTFLPWKRCLQNVKHHNGVQVAFNMVFTEERDSAYILTRHLFTTKAYFFYSRNHYPTGINIESASDLVKSGVVCGRFGSNYTGYGVNNNDVLRSAHTFEKLLQLLKIGHCDTFLARYEVLAGYKLLKEELFSGVELGYKPIPGIQPTRFYMGISRNYEFSEELKVLLDSGISEMESSGELEQIMRQYLANLK
ncbi:substrate-binding periplasmic protein [Psychromonas ossibalaenae]|uniref:substrate-binding periplasmic protein n=1 Tax=Psychromonas ossibalaenae TaxID=444922 RepID=UPI00146ECC68|nr:transporter substrate-binding domain-containing protein [Psychromonas ossibalaenae]